MRGKRAQLAKKRPVKEPGKKEDTPFSIELTAPKKPEAKGSLIWPFFSPQFILEKPILSGNKKILRLEAPLKILCFE